MPGDGSAASLRPVPYRVEVAAYREGDIAALYTARVQERNSQGSPYRVQTARAALSRVALEATRDAAMVDAALLADLERQLVAATGRVLECAGVHREQFTSPEHEARERAARQTQEGARRQFRHLLPD